MKVGAKNKEENKVREQLIEEIERLRQEVDKLRQEKSTRKHAQEALRESEERLRSLLENIPDFVITVDRNHKILMINRGIPGIVTAEQAIGTEVYSYVEPAHHEIMRESLEKVFQTGMPQRYEVLGMGPEGPDTAWYETRVSPNKLDGQVISVTLISSDITKRKKAEEEVATEKKKFENYVESMADGLCVNDTNGTITQVNEALIRMFGYKSPEERIGKTIFENIAKREIPRVTKRFTETVKNEESGIKDFEVICLRTDGSEFPVSFNIRNLWESKKYVGSISIARDITERKKTEEVLESEKKKLESYIESMVDGVVISDLKGTTVDINKACLELLGYKRKEDIVGRPGFIRAISNKDMPEIVALLEEIIKKGYVKDREITVLAQDRREIPILLSATLIKDPEGKPTSIFTVFKDITEQKKAGEEITRLSQALAMTATGVVLVDPDGKVMDVNEATLRRHGFADKQSVLGKPVLDLVAPEQREAAAADMQDLWEKDELTGEYEIITEDGKIVPVETSVTVMKDADGKVIGLVAITNDITERKKAEAQIRELSSAVEQSIDGIATGDLEPKLTYVNDAFARMHGYSPGEMIGMPVANLHSEEQMDEFKKGIDHLKMKGSWIGEIGHAKKDRTHFPTQMSVTLLTDKQGKPTGIAAVCRDITEQKKAEENLKESEERYRNLFETATDGIVTLDVTGRFTSCNKKIEEICGYKQEELTGKHFTALLPEKEAQRMSKGLQRVLRGRTTTYQTEIKTKSGNLVPMEVTTAALRRDAEVIGALEMVRDITSRKRAEETLREIQSRMQSIIETVPSGLFAVDLKRRITLWSPAAEVISGIKARDAVGKICTEIWNCPVCFEKCVLFDEHVEKPILGTECSITTLQGKKFTISKNAAVLRDAEGKIVGGIESFVDITEQKQMWNMLRESEERYRNLLETATDGIFTMDLQTRFTSGNRKAEEMCGYSRDELIGQYATVILPEEEIPRMADALKKVLRGKIDTYETRIITKNGELLPVEVTSSPIETDGKIIGTMGIARDITERKQAEEALRESEEKYRDLVENINDAIYAADRDGTVTYISPVIEWLIGYSPSEIIGRSVAEFFYEEDLPRAMEDFKRILSGHSAEGEYRFHTKSGEIRWLGTSNRPIFAGDSVVGAHGTITDITKRKLAELASEEARTRFEDLFETANELIITTDPEGWVLHVNKEVERLSGFSKEELIGQSILEIAHPEDVPKYIQFWKDILSGLAPHYELRSISKKKPGKMRYLLASGSVIRKDGKIVEIQYNAKDISEEKQTEEKLRESEKKYRTILENMTEGYYEVDLAGNFTFFNDAMRQILGYTRAEMIGMNNRQYMDKENARKVYQMFNNVYTTGKPSSGFDWEFIRKDGTKRFVETSVSLIRDAAGNPAGFRGILRDITARQEMEEEKKMLEQRAQLTSRLNIVGEMASGILHELNNPLTSVVGFAQLLAQQDLPEHAREYARIINNEGQRVANIAGRIVDFARHEKPERVYTDINQLIESTLELQAYEMEAGNIKVTTQLDPDLPRTMADAGQLQQVFLNIILNAKTEMQSAHDKGKLLVKTEAIDNIIRISFEDDGPGIAKENLEKIFEPFFTTREVGTATGLGLSICHEIIANHNGQIYARSIPGKGATFIIELPVVARQRKTATIAGVNVSIV
jgi:PAS domain S-box-containing protein